MEDAKKITRRRNSAASRQSSAPHVSSPAGCGGAGRSSVAAGLRQSKKGPPVGGPEDYAREAGRVAGKRELRVVCRQLQ